MESNLELKRRVSQLESRLDQREAELSYLNTLLLNCGFPEGIQSLKYTIEDLLRDESSQSHSFPPDRLSKGDLF